MTRRPAREWWELDRALRVRIAELAAMPGIHDVIAGLKALRQ